MIQLPRPAFYQRIQETVLLISALTRTAQSQIAWIFVNSAERLRIRRPALFRAGKRLLTIPEVSEDDAVY